VEETFVRVEWLFAGAVISVNLAGSAALAVLIVDALSHVPVGAAIRPMALFAFLFGASLLGAILGMAGAVMCFGSGSRKPAVLALGLLCLLAGLGPFAVSKFVTNAVMADRALVLAD
jgi:hypothetical protein